MFQYPQEPGSAGLIVGALDVWLLGYSEQARRWSDRAIILAREAAHAYTLAFTLAHASWLHHFCRERAVAQEQAEEVIAVATKQGFALPLAWGTIMRGWALAHQGKEEGITQIRQGLAAVQAAEMRYLGMYHLTLLAEAYHDVGEPAAGLAAWRQGESWDARMFMPHWLKCTGKQDRQKKA